MRNAGTAFVFDKDYRVGIRKQGATSGWLALCDGVKLNPGEEKTSDIVWGAPAKAAIVELAKKGPMCR